MRLSEHQFKFTLDTCILIWYAYKQGYKLTYGEAHRPSIIQKIYLLTNRYCVGEIIKFRDIILKVIGQGGKIRPITTIEHSTHQDRLAVDFNLFIKKGDKWVYTRDKKIYQRLGEYWELLDNHNEWGGRWKKPVDIWHFQRNKVAKRG